MFRIAIKLVTFRSELGSVYLDRNSIGTPEPTLTGLTSQRNEGLQKILVYTLGSKSNETNTQFTSTQNNATPSSMQHIALCSSFMLRFSAIISGAPFGGWGQELAVALP